MRRIPPEAEASKGAWQTNCERNKGLARARVRARPQPSCDMQGGTHRQKARAMSQVHHMRRATRANAGAFETTRHDPPALARICGTAVRVPILRSPYALLHHQRTPAEAGGLVRHLRLGVYQGRLWGPMPQGRVSGGISGNHAKAPAAPHSVVGHRVEPQFQGMAGKVVGGCQKTRPSTSSAGTR